MVTLTGNSILTKIHNAVLDLSRFYLSRSTKMWVLTSKNSEQLATGIVKVEKVSEKSIKKKYQF